VALFLAGGLGAILSDAYGQQELHVRTVQRTADVSISIFQTYVIPFEVASVLLLAALVGAVVIARRD
jgi:NADH-quinone oxidoreductase subunit J